MRLEIASSLPASIDVERYAEGRLRSELASFAEQLETVTLSLLYSDDKDPTSIICRIKVQIRAGISLIQETRDVDPYAAVVHALDGLKKSFIRWMALRAGPAANAVA